MEGLKVKQEQVSEINAELLEALKLAVEDMEEYGIFPQRQDRFRELIAKAEGRA